MEHPLPASQHAEIPLPRLQARNVFSHKTQTNGCRHIVKLAVFLPWKTYKYQCVHLPAFLHNGKERFLCPIQQNLLPEQIFTGITGDAKLWKNNYLCSAFCSHPHIFTNLFRIIFTVRHTDIRCYCRCFYKTIPHNSVCPFTFFWIIFSLPLPAAVLTLPSETYNLYYRNDSSFQSAFLRLSFPLFLFPRC